ncbi:MAG TPA: SCO family protein [Mycobacteriales bacterium]|nr:SCO family protein [Mycobacteriales bacterium]
MNLRQPSRGASIALVVLGLTVACGGARPPQTVAVPAPSVGQVVNARLPAAIAMMPLTEANGTRTDLAAFHGKTVMIADFMSLCTDICPMISANAASIARSLGGDGDSARTALLEISIDPHRDTPARLRAYQRLYGSAPSNWYLLRASAADTAKLWRYFGVYVRRVSEGTAPDRDWLTGKPLTYDVAHSDDVIFLNPAGQERFVVDGNPDAAVRTLPRILLDSLSAQGRQLLHHPDPAQDWTTSQALRVFSWLLDRPLGQAAA